MKLPNGLFSLVLFCGLSVAQAVKAETSGVLGIFQSDNHSDYQKTINKLEHQLNGLNCILRREGKIVKVQGEYELQQVNQFFFLECESSILSKNITDSWLVQLNKTTKNLAILEGAFLDLNRDLMTSSGTERAYIIKLSDYNNANPKQRDIDLSEIDKMVKTREHKYTNEAAFSINDAYGMKRTDEVTVIHYDFKEDGDIFRENNGDILTKIGQFNQNHLTQFAYLIAQSNR